MPPQIKNKKAVAIGVVAFWGLMLPLGGFCATHYLGNTGLNYFAPKGSSVANTQDTVWSHFTFQVLHDPLYLLFQNTTVAGTLTNNSNPLFEALSKNLSWMANEGPWSEICISAQGYYLSDVPQVQGRFVGTGAYSDRSLLLLDVDNKEEHMKEFVPVVEAYINQWLNDHRAPVDESATQKTNGLPIMGSDEFSGSESSTESSSGGTNHHHRRHPVPPPSSNTVPLDIVYTGDISFVTTSIWQVGNDLTSGVLGELGKIDLISIPFATLALSICVRSVRMLILPAISIPVVFACGLGVMYPVSLAMSVSSFAPELSAAVMLAISLDYTLFICSRFNEQVALQEALAGEGEKEEAEKDGDTNLPPKKKVVISEETKWLVAWNTLRLSAENIVVSGFTIAAALGGMATLPVSFLASIGVAFGVGCVFAVAVNLTLMPCVLYLGYNFFRVQSEIPRCLRNLLPCFKTTPEEQEEAEVRQAERTRLLLEAKDGGESGGHRANGSSVVFTPPPDDSATTNNSEPSGAEALKSARAAQALLDHEEKERRLQFNSIWYKIGNTAFKRPFLLALVVTVLGVPFFYLTTTIKTNFSLFMQVPLGAPHADRLEIILDHVGDSSQGVVCYYVLYDTGVPLGIRSNDAFNQSNALVNHISQATGTPLANIQSFNMPTAGFQVSALWEAESLYLVDPAYQALWNHTIDETQRMALIWVCPPLNPFGDKAPDYLDKLADALDDANGDLHLCNATCGFMGAGAESWAIMNAVLDFFPKLIGVTFGFIFVFIAVVFRSIFIPIRMLFTVSFTVAFAFGIAVIFFQYDWLHSVWTSLRGVNSFVWLVPIMTFSLLCALALDYDVFLVTRIIELKRLGFNDEAAISKAVWKTGRIISFAGVIMGISFGSMVFSNVVTLNQFGFVSFVAVMTDTMVIRPVLTPALMSMKPSLSWWPRKFTETLGVDDMKESGHQE